MDDQGGHRRGVAGWATRCRNGSASSRRAKPAEAVAGNVVFDAPPKHYRLRVSDENGEQPALVDIPLNFNSDIPPAPIPGLSAPGKK
ncbi:MAG: hypothetical protein WDO73_21410 [Ignavibacteriota bacterium]